MSEPTHVLLRLVACQLDALAHHLGVPAYKRPMLPLGFDPSPDELSLLFAPAPQSLPAQPDADTPESSPRVNLV